MRILIQFFLFLLPWEFRRILLNAIFHYDIDEKAYIGLSVLLAAKVTMKSGARMGHFNVVKPIDEFYMGENSSMGKKNWITGFPVSSEEKNGKGHFSHISNRQSKFVLGDESRITARHYFDCNGGIFIGRYVTVAGFESAFLTHSIDLKECRQDALPIYIGDYCFISTRCTIVKGSSLPDKSVLGACSLLNKRYETSGLYAGVNAKFIKTLSDYKYFERESGFVI